VPTATEVPPTEAPATEAPTATEVPPTEAPATEAPTATEAPPTEAPTATEVPATEEAPITLDGRSLLEERCTVCHDLGRVERSKKTEEEWKATVERMVGKGAQLDEAEQELLIKYLAETYPK
jgi:cytochrome c5